MGPQKVKVNSPRNFLRKSEMKPSEKKSFQYPGPKKEALPGADELNYKDRDFILKNCLPPG